MDSVRLRQEGERVLEFWFGPAPGRKRAVWFEKDSAFDAMIRARFSELHARAASGACDGMAADARGNLALVILLDQFSRNLYRGDPRAYACDGMALARARDALGKGYDRALPDVERQFFYLPFEHSEDPEVQAESVSLFDTIPDERARYFARRHYEIIERFGRFPHRNRILGRTSTAEELAFLEEPHSSF